MYLSNSNLLSNESESIHSNICHFINTFITYNEEYYSFFFDNVQILNLTKCYSKYERKDIMLNTFHFAYSKQPIQEDWVILGEPDPFNDNFSWDSIIGSVLSDEELTRQFIDLLITALSRITISI